MSALRIRPPAVVPLLALGALVASAPLPAQPAPAGLQRVDVHPPCCPEAPLRFQVQPAVAPLVTGGYGVVYADQLLGIVETTPDWRNVRGRLLDAEGVPVGAELPVRADPREDLSFRLDVAGLAGGGLVAVWSDGDGAGAGAGVAARVFDAHGQPLGESFAVPGELAGDQDFPRVAALEDGGFVAVWLSIRRGREPSGAAGVFVRRFNAAGQPLGDELRLLPQTPPAGPDVAALTGGGFVVVAVERASEPVATSRTLLWRFDREGRVKGEPVEVNAGTRVASLPGGGFAIYGESVQRFDAWGRPREQPMPLTIHAQAAAADSAGNLLVVGNVRIGASTLLAAQFLAAGDAEPTPAFFFGLGLGLRHGEGPADVAAGADGSFLAVWAIAARLGTQPDDETGLGVFAQRFVADAPGVVVPGAQRLAVVESAGSVEIPLVRREGSRGPHTVAYSTEALDAREGLDFIPVEGTVTFPDGDSRPRSITVPLLDDGTPERDERFRVRVEPITGSPAAGAQEVEVEIRDDDHPSPQLGAVGVPLQIAPPGRLSDLRLAADRTGGFVLAWTRYESFPEAHQNLGSVEAHRIDGQGRVLAEVRRSRAPEFDLEVDDLVAHPEGMVLGWSVVFVDSLGIIFRTPVVQRFDLSGIEAGPPLAVRDPAQAVRPRLGPTVRSYALAALPGGRAAVAASALDGDGAGIFLELYDASGERYGSIRVHDSTEGFQLHPAIAASPQGRMVVVWESVDPDRPGGDIYLRRFDAAGNPWSPEVRVTSSSTREAATPRVAMDSQGRFVVLWWGREPEGPGLYVRAFHASGEPAGGPVPVDVRGQTGPWTPWTMALRDDGRFLVVWSRSDGTRAQSFAFPGIPLGSGSRIPTTPAGASARIAVGPDDPFLAGWVTDAEGVRARTLAELPLRARRIGREAPAIAPP